MMKDLLLLARTMRPIARIAPVLESKYVPI